MPIPFRYLTQSPLRTAGIGAAAGGLLGGVHGAATPQEGEGRLGAGLRGAWTGAVRGGALGGGAAALGRGYRDTRLLDPGSSALGAVGGTARRIAGGLANFGKRQVHGITGKLDPDAIGMAGNTAAAKKVHLLQRRHLDDMKHAPGNSAKLLADHESQVQSVLGEGRAAQRLRDTGLTNVPGIVRALRSSETRGPALRAMGAAAVGNGVRGGAAFAVGLPLAINAPNLMRGDESAQGGHTLGQKLRGLGAGVAANSLVGGLPLVPQMVVGGFADTAARRLTMGKRRIEAQQ